MSLLRIPFVLSAAWALHVSARAPNPPPEVAEKRIQTGLESIWVKVSPWSRLIAKVRIQFFWPYLTDIHTSPGCLGYLATARSCYDSSERDVVVTIIVEYHIHHCSIQLPCISRI
jgi:hypothetical protein